MISIDRPSQRRRHVRWPLSGGAAGAQVTVTGLVVFGPAAVAGMLVRGPLTNASTTGASGLADDVDGIGVDGGWPAERQRADHRRRADHLGLKTPAGRVIGAGGSVTASSSPGQATRPVVTVPPDHAVAEAGGTS